MTEAAAQVTLTAGMRVRIVAGRFTGESGRLLSPGQGWATVDLGVAIDGGSGIVVVPVSAVQEVDQ